MNFDRPRTLLLAIDLSPPSLPLLDAAAELAAMLEVDLEVLRVEEQRLFDMLDLPFCRRVLHHAPAPVESRSSDLERELRLHRRRIEQGLSASAGRWQVKCSFRNVRGETGLELLDALQANALLCAGVTLWRQWEAGFARQSAQAGAAETGQFARQSSVWLPSNPLRGEEVVAIVTRQDAALVLDAVKPLVHHGRRPVVIVLAEQPEQAEILEQQVRTLLAAEGINPRIERWHSGDFDQLCQFLRSRAIRFLLLSASNPQVPPQQMERLVQAAGAPVMVVSAGVHRDAD